MSDDLVKRESLAEDKVLDGSNCPRAFNPGGQVSHPTWKQKEVLTCFSSWNSFGSHHVSVGSYERKASSNSDMRPRWVKFGRCPDRGGNRRTSLVNMFTLAVLQESYKRHVLQMTMEDEEEKSSHIWMRGGGYTSLPVSSLAMIKKQRTDMSITM